MKKMPFDVFPTKVHKVEGVWGEPPPEQLSRADELIRDHLGRRSRIFVIGRTRGDVPRLAQRLEADVRHPPCSNCAATWPTRANSPNAIAAAASR